MRPDALRRRFTPWLLLALVCLAAAVVGWFSTRLPQRATGTDATVEWKLPQWKSAGVEAAARRLAERSIWEPQAATASAVAPTASKPRTPPDWRIVAVAISKEERVAMLAVDGERPQELRIGDRLPGGAIIRGIEPDRLQIELNGERRILRLAPQ